jgi:sterol desaturase/sphingolipid hydroxylase (fatty acid hydroxylase superfamily)
MFKYITAYILTPFVEWTIHRLLHYVNESIHLNHHKEVREKLFNNLDNTNKKEYWILFSILISSYYEYYAITLGLARYGFNHTMIHYSDFESFEDIKKHHIIHHKNNKYNFAVSDTLPDILLGTFKD